MAATLPLTPHGRAPALVEGAVIHRRARPVAHAFTYPSFCLRIPLSRLGDLPRLGVAHNRSGVVSFHDRDHGAGDGSPLLPWIRALLAAEGIAADGEIDLYAFPRMLGYAFKPVSFWVCRDAAGAVRAVLAEVNNTFGERHNYLVARSDGGAIASAETLRARKVFHVSPFCDVRGHYAFRFHFEGDRWLARIDYFDDETDVPLLATSLSGRSQPLTAQSVRLLLFRYRWFTLGVIARIHWQAAKLWLKRVPFFTKPAPPALPITR
jgi:hypothetical protein